MTRARLSAIAAIGAIVLAMQAGTAVAHTFTVQNCTGQGADFNSYNEGDKVHLSSVQVKYLENGTSGTLRCDTSNYCQVQAIDGLSPLYRVSGAITFYSHRDHIHSIDADCSQGPAQ